MKSDDPSVCIDEEELETVFLRLSDVDANRADNINPLLEDGNCWMEWPDEPWSIQYYFSTRGQDNGHIYFWIMKDLSWLQCWFYTGHIFGILALLWSLFMVVKAINYNRYDDAFIVFCQLIWLSGNFLWMRGELYDEKYPNRTSIYDDRARQAGYFLLTSFCLICAYYVIYLPVEYYWKLSREASGDNGEDVPSTRKETYDPVSRVYNRLAAPYTQQQQPSQRKRRIYNRYPSLLFSSWKHYENVHILLWLGKDTAWNWDWKVMWIIFVIPTVLIGVDFIHKSLFTQRLLIDHAHYCAQFIWVMSNLVWAYGELFLPEVRDGAISFWVFSSDAKKSARWYSTWVLLFAFVPLLLMYVIWIYGTIYGKISMPLEISRIKRRQEGANDTNNNAMENDMDCAANLVEPLLLNSTPLHDPPANVV